MCPRKDACTGQLGVRPACCLITSYTVKYVHPFAQERCTELEEEEVQTLAEEQVADKVEEEVEVDVEAEGEVEVELEAEV